MDELFGEYHIPLLKNIDHPALIQEWTQNIDANAYGKYLNQEIKPPSKKGEIDRHDSMTYCTTSIKKLSTGLFFLI